MQPRVYVEYEEKYLVMEEDERGDSFEVSLVRRSDAEKHKTEAEEVHHCHSRTFQRVTDSSMCRYHSQTAGHVLLIILRCTQCDAFPFGLPVSFETITSISFPDLDSVGNEDPIQIIWQVAR